MLKQHFYETEPSELADERYLFFIIFILRHPVFHHWEARIRDSFRIYSNASNDILEIQMTAFQNNFLVYFEVRNRLLPFLKERVIWR